MSQNQPFNQPVNPFQQQAIQEQQFKIKELQQANDSIRNHVISTFCNPHGLQLLDSWEKLYFRLMPICPPGAPEGYGYAQSAVIQFINSIRKIVTQAQLAIPGSEPKPESVSAVENSQGVSV